MTDKDKLNIALYEKMFLIREAERVIIELYGENEMKTPMHMSMGGEAIAAGVCQAINGLGQIFCSYRSHGVYLANTGDTDKFFAEFYGKETGVVGGVGGSMHLSCPETGFLGASAIVGSTVPLAIGAAFANRYKKGPEIAAVFFGDGAVDEGCFWESLNFACLQKLPVLFICENNGLAEYSEEKQRHGYKSLTAIVKRFNCTVSEVSTNDPEKIYNVAKAACLSMINTPDSGPFFLHFRYCRFLEHVGVKRDSEISGRSIEEMDNCAKNDPVVKQRGKLLRLGAEKELIQMELEISRKVAASVTFAQNSKFPGKKHLYENVLAEV